MEKSGGPLKRLKESVGFLILSLLPLDRNCVGLDGVTTNTAGNWKLLEAESI